MKIDLQLLSTVASAAADAERARASGFDGISFSEITGDPFLRVAAASQVPDLTVSTCLSVALARSPMAMAMTALDLSVATGGRFWLGLGSQVRTHLRRRYSVPGDQVLGRMAEYVDALRAIWTSWETSEPLAFRGRYFQHTLMLPMFVPAVVTPTPPILLGAVGPDMAALAGRSADAVVAHAIVGSQYLRDTYLPALERGEQRRPAGGRCERWIGTILVPPSLGASERAAIEEARRMVTFFAATPSYQGALAAIADRIPAITYALSRQDFTRASAHISDELLREFVLFGSTDTIVEQVAHRYEGQGIDRLGFSVVGPDTGALPALLQELRADRAAAVPS